MNGDTLIESIPPALAFAMLCRALMRISDEQFFASWSGELEYHAWGWTQHDSSHSCPLPRYEIDLLAALGHQAEGWALWGKDGLTFLPMDEWLELYRAWDSQNAMENPAPRTSTEEPTIQPITPMQAAAVLRFQVPKLAECLLLRHLHAAQSGTPIAAHMLGAALHGLVSGYETALGHQDSPVFYENQEVINPLVYENMEELFGLSTDDYFNAKGKERHIDPKDHP